MIWNVCKNFRLYIVRPKFKRLFFISFPCLQNRHNIWFQELQIKVLLFSSKEADNFGENIIFLTRCKFATNPHEKPFHDSGYKTDQTNVSEPQMEFVMCSWIKNDQHVFVFVNFHNFGKYASLPFLDKICVCLTIDSKKG